MNRSKNVKMIIEVNDFPQDEELLSRINLTGIPESEEHLETLFKTFESMWPRLKKQAKNNLKLLSGNVEGKTINAGGDQ